MARCNSCNGIIAKTDLECFVCGEPVLGRAEYSLLRLWDKLTAPSVKRATVAEQRVTMADMKPDSESARAERLLSKRH